MASECGRPVALRTREATVDSVDHDALFDLFDETANAVVEALDGLDDWGLVGATDQAFSHAGQYSHDLKADAAALGVLLEAGVGVLSEESGLHAGDRDVVVVVDPVDGSTNASLGIPWYAISLAAVVDDAVEVALVMNLATRTTYAAKRGGGATRNGRPVRPRQTAALSDAIVAFSGYPHRHFGWRQYRSLGASALDLCAVAGGTLDGFLDLHRLAPWDYLGALLVCQEAGVSCVEVFGEELVVLDHEARRTLAAGVTPGVLDALVAARRENS